MNKRLTIIAILALALVSAAPEELVRLTLINKSGMRIAVQLRSTEDELLVYYLPVEAGDKQNPTSRTYTIRKDSYVMQLHYIETYDPVYGFKCYPQPPNGLLAFRNLRVVFLECGQAPPNPGERSMVKYLPVVNTQYGKVVLTRCMPLAVRLGLVTKCWQYRYIY
jgi:hypothetical protein